VHAREISRLLARFVNLTVRSALNCTYTRAYPPPERPSADVKRRGLSVPTSEFPDKRRTGIDFFLIIAPSALGPCRGDVGGRKGGRWNSGGYEDRAEIRSRMTRTGNMAGH